MPPYPSLSTIYLFTLLAPLLSHAHVRTRGATARRACTDHDTRGTDSSQHSAPFCKPPGRLERVTATQKIATGTHDDRGGSPPGLSQKVADAASARSTFIPVRHASCWRVSPSVACQTRRAAGDTRRTRRAAHGASRLDAASGSSGRLQQCSRRDACATTPASSLHPHDTRAMFGVLGGHGGGARGVGLYA